MKYVVRAIAAFGAGCLLGGVLLVAGQVVNMHIRYVRYTDRGRPCLREYRTNGVFTACGNRYWYPVP